MDHIILHIPNVRTILLNDIFQKEEQEYCSISKTFLYQIMTKEFVKRIKELEKILKENEKFEIISEKKDYILKYIEEFKDELYRKVMNKNIYSLFVICNKNKNEDFGICGWTTKFYREYLINIENKSYEQKLYYCHLTDEEKKFECTKPIKNFFDFLNLFFKEEYFYENKYNIPTNDIIRFKRKYINEIRNKSCDGNFVCPKETLCKGHKFIYFLEKIFEAMTFSVMEKKVFFKYFLFYNVVKKDGEIFSWDFIPSQYKDISNLSYSKRLAFLN